MAEGDVGIEAYLTVTPGVGGRLKERPEDFVVEELSLPPPQVEGGKYAIARVRSRNWETNRLVRQMARALRISRQRIAFAGTKDKRSVATRLFSFELPVADLRRLHLADVEVLEAYPSDRPMAMGDLRGNRFTITVRGMAAGGAEARGRIDGTLAVIAAAGGFPNFFGLQRFGSRRPITHVVGRHIVRGDFRAAVDAYVANPLEGEDEESFAAREALQESGDYRAALAEYPDILGFEKTVLNHLVAHPGDFVGALGALPANLLLMFVHGYQSFLFNRMLSERLRRALPIHRPVPGDLVLPVGADGLVDRERWVPVGEGNLEKVRAQCAAGKAFVSGVLFGADSTFAGGAMGEIEAAAVAAEGVAPKDFVVPAIPRLTTRGTRRELLCPTGEVSVAVEGDAATFGFSLPRGSYATCLLREILKDEAGLG
jgi:tRNA pseudouridine13 synthase